MKSADILKAPEFLRSIGLDAMEYEAVRGVNISEEKARAFGAEAEKYDIKLSLHAPYFINLSSRNEKTVQASIERLKQSILASYWMGAYVVVFHPGYYKDMPSREDALRAVIENLKPVAEFRDSLGAKNVWIGPETTGKTSQVGDVDETIEICSRVEGARPVVDWAHIYARSGGKFIVSKDDVISVVEKIEKVLGEWAVKPLHMHFSKIEYGKGGEREHHTLGEAEYGPDFEIVCSALTELGVEGIFISESPILEQDALVMKEICARVGGTGIAEQAKEKSGRGSRRARGKTREGRG
ncbi:deoxyribonuclease IV [Thermogladius sp. 4427co]|uniref:deoxyribonuclease IV n=1 Tax=Thermogladius sp. 4427co TaxID=3450718 RepID=UPI003F7A1EE6